MSDLKLNQTRITSFHWTGQTFKVVDAPAPIFDDWISQVYEEITDIDRTAWDVYARWDIINDALRNNDMRLVVEEDGLLLEVARAEEKTTAPEERASGGSTPEVPRSTESPEGISVVTIPGAPIISGWATIIKATVQDSARAGSTQE